MALGLATGWVSGCAHLPEEVQTTEGFASPRTAYGKALARYTRKAELYEGLDTVAKAWSTWRSSQLRQALAETTIQAFQLSGEAAETVRRDEERAGRRVREFHLALYTPKTDWNDLESADTLWRTFLELPGNDRLEPVRIIHLTKTDKSAVEYPYVSPWTREYALFFPLLTETERHENMTLVLTGPLGTMRFAF